MDTLLALGFIVAVGFVAGRFGITKNSSRAALNNFVFYIAIPAAIVSALLEQEAGDLNRYGKFMAINFAVYISLFVILRIISLAMKKPYQQGSVLAMSASTPNTVFLGFPLVWSVFGSEAFIYVVLLGTVVDALLNTVRITIIESSKSSGQTHRTKLGHLMQPLLTPITYATIVGFGLLLLNVTLPAALDNGLGLLAGTASACALFALGVGLSGINIARSLMLRVSLIAALKLGLQPLLMLVVMNMLNINGDAMRVSVLVAALPTAVITSVFATRLKLDEDLASGVILVSTVLSLATIPLWLNILS